MAKLLDGKACAAWAQEALRPRVSALVARGVTPGLAVVQVGADPASSVYVRNKRRTTEALGMASFAHDLDAQSTQAELLEVLDVLNADPRVHGVLVQLPLPRHIDAETVLKHIDPRKDVDGFHPMNAGRLALGQHALVPCTPLGVLVMLQRYEIPLEGRRALVIGRSNIVGKPMAQLLLGKNATVTIAHSKSRDLPALCAEHEIVVAAVGQPEMVRGSWVRPGAVVVDVGIHRAPSGGLVGDVAFAEVEPVASWIPPVPGGVGPMTIAMLMQNTVTAAELFGPKALQL